MSNKYKFLKKQRYEYYKGTSEIVDNELDDFVDDVVERLNTQDFNKLELLKVKQIQDEQIAELKTKLAEKDQDKISFTLEQLEQIRKEFEIKFKGCKWEDKMLVGKFCNITNEIIDNQIKQLKEKQNG